jgi:hypothetical protein
MSQSFARSLDALGGWRVNVESRLKELTRFLGEHELLDEPANDLLDSLRLRLSGDKLVVAFVAEFSRGKSELINAIFFADAGRRILPATPGRTTMCPVELGYDADEDPGLALLPIDTRLDNLSLAELRQQPKAWKVVPLDLSDPDALAESLTEVMRTKTVPVDTARALGFWDDERPQDNPPADAHGQVEVPAWRHALINVPHPLLRRGLVVLDTPGLNAIGAEPELTVGLLPSAHATVFILSADTGVTKSDLSIWRDHLGGQGLARYVALNKIDALVDPLSPKAHTDAQIARQCEEVARTLDVPHRCVFPISARQALAARVAKDDAGLAESRLPALEAALADELLPQRREVLEQVTLEGAQQVQSQVTRRLNDRRRQLAEQMLELRGLRGKNTSKVRLMVSRVEAEVAEFEQCTSRLQAMRMVHTRMLKDALVGLSSDRLREQVDAMQEAVRGSLLQLGAKKAFVDMCAGLRKLIESAQDRGNEIHDMLAASFNKLNAEFGFGLSVAKGPDLSRFVRDLELIERNYVQYLGITQALRLSQPRFMEQFRRMLVSRLRVVFESACGELELWNKTASAQIDSQLRERRRAFKRRRESMERIQQAAGELEHRLSELDSQDQRLQQLQARLKQVVDVLAAAARAKPGEEPSAAAAAAVAPLADGGEKAAPLNIKLVDLPEEASVDVFIDVEEPTAHLIRA